MQNTQSTCEAPALQNLKKVSLVDKKELVEFLTGKIETSTKLRNPEEKKPEKPSESLKRSAEESATENSKKPKTSPTSSKVESSQPDATHETHLESDSQVIRNILARERPIRTRL